MCLCGIHRDLKQYTTVLQAEVQAIKACITQNINMDYYNINTYILSESQAATTALDSYQTVTKLVWDCHNSP